MRRPLLLLASWALVSLLSGCAVLGAKRGVSEEDLSQTRRIGVVSLLGDRLYGVRIGTTVFQNDSFVAQVPEWKVDAYATDRAVALLKDRSSFEAAPLDRGELVADRMPVDGWQQLKTAGARQGFDRLVIVRPGTASTQDRGFFTPGYGLIERSFFGLVRRCVYAAYIVDVMDVKTGEEIAWQWGSDFPCEYGKAPQLPILASFDQYSDVQRESVRVGLMQWIDKSMADALGALKLIPAPR
ncbi:hypothetical protein [Rubrivivax gelatinosus]|uniref:Lipoprotein n=1 Tax=Rubrivivax gelatinosus (strain NBRC 100245 / IL144) TaxID=983917 RepID=I0HP45_RUBGI|nr:hypothetical protein [Rubrivivax gelatinosus]BAL94782.1 hypothetical protein RGE_14410 [Rubrivivax gelatinosus IL144]